MQCGLVPSTPECTAAVQWFREYFDACGDHAPNGRGTHLEITDKIDIYRTYEADMQQAGDEILDYTRWIRLWETVFPYVTMRTYKQVTGKCWTCYYINEGRRKHNTHACQVAYKQAHMLHRCGLYMRERLEYKARVNHARERKSTHASWIIDGMDQNHTRIPRAGVNQTWPEAISQHITGVLEHGESITLYRSFDNVSKGSNLTTMVFLRQLEKWRSRHFGKFPEVIYLQVDGGSENANKYLLGLNIC